MNESNPRKRSAQSMMFQRALMGLQRNSGPKPLDPPQKRARVMDESSSSNSDSFNHSNGSRRSQAHSQPRHQRQFKPPPKEPQHNFLYDRQRDHHNQSHYGNKAARHTPSTRFFGKARQQPSHHHHHQHHNNNYHNHGRSNNNHYRHDRHSQHSNNYRKSHYQQQQTNKKLKTHNKKYKQMEENRMRKLWTDFMGNHESILSELKFCRDTSYFVTSNSIAHKMSSGIKLILSEYFEQDTGIKILDGLSCIGGNTYSFAKVFDALSDDIYANELDTSRFLAMKHNMHVFAEHGLIQDRSDTSSRFHFYNMDFLQLHQALGAETCGAMDVVFLDPEWNNGDDYKQTNREMIHLFNIGALHLYQVVDEMLNAWYVNLKIIAIKVAKNYDQEFLMRKFQKCKLIETKQFRIAQLSFHNQKLILIVRVRHGMSENGKQDQEQTTQDEQKVQANGNGNVEKLQQEEEEEDDDDDVDLDVNLDEVEPKSKMLPTLDEIVEALPAKMTNNKDGVALNNRDIVTVQMLS